MAIQGLSANEISARAYSQKGHDPRVDKQAGYMSATSEIHSEFSLANRSRSIHWAQSRSSKRGPAHGSNDVGICDLQ